MRSLSPGEKREGEVAVGVRLWGFEGVEKNRGVEERVLSSIFPSFITCLTGFFWRGLDGDITNFRFRTLRLNPVLREVMAADPSFIVLGAGLWDTVEAEGWTELSFANGLMAVMHVTSEESSNTSVKGSLGDIFIGSFVESSEGLCFSSQTSVELAMPHFSLYPAADGLRFGECSCSTLVKRSSLLRAESQQCASG